MSTTRWCGLTGAGVHIPPEPPESLAGGGGSPSLWSLRYRKGRSWGRRFQMQVIIPRSLERLISLRARRRTLPGCRSGLLLADSSVARVQGENGILHPVRFVPIYHTSLRVVWGPSQVSAPHGSGAASGRCIFRRLPGRCNCPQHHLGGACAASGRSAGGDGTGGAHRQPGEVCSWTGGGTVSGVPLGGRAGAPSGGQDGSHRGREPLLHTPNFSLPSILQNDTSNRGLGFRLVPGGGGRGGWLSEREARYSTVEKECLAIRWAVGSLRYYLLGRSFTLCSHHAPLQWLHSFKDANARITRWYLALQPFNFKVVHRSGAQMAVSGGGGMWWRAWFGSSAEGTEKGVVRGTVPGGGIIGLR
ncbi:uncharacterized protein LOC144384620 isoform X1 [Gasterosteus aculeatus]